MAASPAACVPPGRARQRCRSASTASSKVRSRRRNVVLNGRVNGDIVGSERVVLGAKARVRGNVHYGVIEMALGAEISGKLVPRNAAETAETAETAESVETAGPS